MPVALGNRTADRALNTGSLLNPILTTVELLPILGHGLKLLPVKRTDQEEFLTVSSAVQEFLTETPEKSF